jgi:hypothetical protein
MKIVVDLIRVRQEWDPETNTHANSIVFGIGGIVVEVPATPEQVKQIILASQEQKHLRAERAVAGIPEPEEPIDDTNYRAEEMSPELEDALAAELVAEEETVFGGDYAGLDPNEPVEPPAIFQGPPSPSVAPSAEEALGTPQAPAPPPKTPTQQREANIAVRRNQDPSQKRKDERAAMRARAARVPARKVEKDELGYPVEQPKSAPIVGPAGRPHVIRRQPNPTVSTGGDDDGFAQG